MRLPIGRPLTPAAPAGARPDTGRHRVRTTPHSGHGRLLVTRVHRAEPEVGTKVRRHTARTRIVRLEPRCLEPRGETRCAPTAPRAGVAKECIALRDTESRDPQIPDREIELQHASRAPAVPQMTGTVPANGIHTPHTRRIARVAASRFHVEQPPRGAPGTSRCARNRVKSDSQTSSGSPESAATVPGGPGRGAYQPSESLWAKP